MVHDVHFGGGIERVTTNMANYFAANNHQVSIVSISSPKTANIFTFDKRVDIKYLNADVELNSNLNSWVKVFHKIISVFAARSYFKKVKNKTFVLGMGTYPALLTALLPQSDSLVKIGCQHGSYASAKSLWFILRWFIFRRLDQVVSLTNYDTVKLKKLNKNVCVIPNSIQLFPDQPADLQNKIILSVGRMDYLKGYDLLLDVFSHFCHTNKDWKLRIIGDGPLRETIGRQIVQKGLADRVSILPVSNVIIEEYLNASVYLMTSRSEGLPMVLLEAQACGLPIISFNCETGPADIINNEKDGYLINDYDIPEMSSRLSELCGDVKKRKEFGQSARENVVKFFPQFVYNKWEMLFSQLQS